MSSLDDSLIRQSLSSIPASRLDDLELFGSIDSTNTYLLGQAAPDAGRYRVAIADHQTSGRGRHNRRWVSSPQSSLCMSLAYSFVKQPPNLPSLTLAIGVGIAVAMQTMRIDGVSLKWPNDIVALDGKLGGVLTETLSRPGDAVTVVVGVGLNIDLSTPLDLGSESEWSHRVVDLKSVANDYPAREQIAGTIIDSLHAVLARFEDHGFSDFIRDWERFDWLRGKAVTVDMPDKQISGIAAGVDSDGALLIDSGSEQIRVISGSIAMADPSEPGR